MTKFLFMFLCISLLFCISLSVFLVSYSPCGKIKMERFYKYNEIPNYEDFFKILFTVSHKVLGLLLSILFLLCIIGMASDSENLFFQKNIKIYSYSIFISSIIFPLSIVLIRWSKLCLKPIYVSILSFGSIYLFVFLTVFGSYLFIVCIIWFLHSLIKYNQIEFQKE